MIKPTASKIPKNAAQPPVGFLNSRINQLVNAGSEKPIVFLSKPPKQAYYVTEQRTHRRPVFVTPMNVSWPYAPSHSKFG